MRAEQLPPSHALLQRGRTRMRAIAFLRAYAAERLTFVNQREGTKIHTLDERIRSIRIQLNSTERAQYDQRSVHDILVVITLTKIPFQRTLRIVLSIAIYRRGRFSRE